MKFIILLCLAVYCAAQVPQPCTSPAQWEARIIQFDPSKDYTMFGKISYDETNTRVRIIEEDRTGGQRDYYDTLFLHNVQKEYRLNLKTKQCNTTTLTRPFRPFSVPGFAKFRFEVQIGAVSVAGEHLTAEVWEGEFSNKDRFMTTVTQPSCVPLQSLFYSNETGLVISDFADETLGIVDPMVFIPPRECTTPP